MSTTTGYVSHYDCSRHDTGWRHPDHQGRLAAVARAVHGDMLTLHPHLVEIEGEPAGRAEVERAHTREYVDRVERRCAEAARAGETLPLEDDVVVSGASWQAALAAVGCGLTAVDRVLKGVVRNAFCAVRPPGRGAGRGAGGGFSVFNSAAVAALSLLEEGEAQSVWVVDVGARPGRGTREILQGAPGARLLAVHSASSLTPGEERPDGSVTRTVERGGGADPIMIALRDVLDRAEEGGAPGFVLLSLGCDMLRGDPLGDLALRPEDLHALTVELRLRSERLCSGRMVSLLEGGYDAEETARAVVQHLRGLAALPPAGRDPNG